MYVRMHACMFVSAGAMNRCSRHWKASPGWQPFTPEFAYKLLHRAEYDPERALRMLDDSAFRCGGFSDILRTH